MSHYQSSGGGRGGASSSPRIFSPGGPPVQPSAAVAKTEDAVQSNSKQLTTQLTKLTLSPSFPFRPSHGTVGRQVTLCANYVELAASPELTLYRYDLSVSPSVVGRKLKQIVRQLLDSPELANFRQDVVSDVKSTLLSRKKLGGKGIFVKVVYRSEWHDEPRDDAPTYTVRLLLTNVLTVGDLVSHLKSITPSIQYVDKQPAIQALNIFLNHHSRVTDDLVAVGSNKTFSLAKDTTTYDLGAGLTAMRVSIRHIPEKKKKSGEVVMRVKNVLGLATLMMAYGRALDANTPAVNVGTRDKPIYLPPEACAVLPGQNARTKLSPEQTQGMIRFAVRKPYDNAESILWDGLSTAGLSARTNPLLARFNISVAQSLIEVHGRVLPEPKVFYKQRGKATPVPAQVRGGGWNMTEVQFTTSSALKSWSYLVITHPGARSRFTTFEEATPVIQSFFATLGRRGIMAGPPMPGKTLALSSPDDPQLANLMRNAEGRLDLLVALPSAT